MKKVILILLSLVLILSVTTAFCDGSQWTCPNCGETGNTGNYCPNCSTPRPSNGVWTCPNCGMSGNTGNFCPNCSAARPLESAWTCPNCGRTGNTENFCPNCSTARPSGQSSGVVIASLKMQLSTRSGPGVNYDEPGTFFYRDNQWKSVSVNVLGKKFSGVWWVLVDFDYGSMGRVRAWTGLKRVDVDLDLLPEINATGTGTVSSTSETYYGPGSNYAKAPDIYGTKSVTIYGRENGYVEVEYRVSDNNTFYRCWVPEGYVH